MFTDPNYSPSLTWWHWAALGVGTAICLAAGGILVAGALGAISTGTLVGATALGAAKGALIAAGIGAATGAASGAVIGAFSGATGSDFWNIVGQSAAISFGIGALTGAISGGIQGYNGWFQARALEFTNYGTTNEVVLGRSPLYVTEAQARNASYFNTTQARWDQVKAMRGVGSRGMWKINQTFLNQQIALGRTFTAVSPVGGYFYAKEIEYLLKLGLIII